MSSNAQNSHGKSIILQSQSMDIDTYNNTKQHHAVAIPLQQISQQPPTTQIQTLESSGSELIKSVQSILNEISPCNISLLTKRFKALPIDNIYCLEKTVNLVFEKAIEEQWFAPLCSSLCSAMQSLQVISNDGRKVTFKNLIITKCQSLFELDKEYEMDSAKKFTKIHLCKDQEKKKELQLQFLETKRRLCKRSVGNCRFIGELFKQKFLPPIIMLLCVQNLSTKYAEVPLECLCKLLETAGKELEQLYNLNDTFKTLQELTDTIITPNVSLRIKSMIRGIIDLRRNKWIPKVFIPEFINTFKFDDNFEQKSISLVYNRPEKRDHRGDHKFKGGEKNQENQDLLNIYKNNTKHKQQNNTMDQSKLQGCKESSSVTTLSSPKLTKFTSSHSNSVLNDDEKSLNTPQIMSIKYTTEKPIISVTEKSQSIMFGVATFMPQFPRLSPSFNFSQTVEEPVLKLDSVVAYRINMKCKNILVEFEQLQNLSNIIYSLSEDESSVIRTRHEEFVKSMSLITLDSNPIIRTTVVGKIFAELLSKKIISMEAITRGIDAVLKYWNDFLVDYPQFFSYIAAIIAPLLLSQNASFDFNNLKDSCTSIRPDNSSKFFTEVLNEIHISKETQNIKEQLGSILWIYNKWRSSEYVPLDVFMPDNQINNFLENNLIGVFLLSIAMYDKMEPIEDKFLFDIIHNWISVNISVEMIKRPQFVLALTVAVVIICSKQNHSYDDFFNHVHVKLLNCYIRFEPLLELEIQAREVQCLYGIQIMSASLQHPGGMVLKLFHKLYQDRVISKESFELFIKEYEETADL